MIIDYSDEKLEIIKDYSIEILLKFLNEIKGSEERKQLKQLLEPFVDKKSKHEKSDTVKYGIKTKERYCLAIKNELGGFFASTNKQKKCSSYEKAKTILPELFLCWLSSNIARQLGDYIKNKNIDEKELDISDLRFVDFLIEQNSDYLISQEIIETFYIFSPIISSANFDEKIQNCKTGADIIKHLQKNLPSKDESILYETKISEIIDKNTNLQKEIDDKENQIDYWESENKKLRKELNQCKRTDIDKMKENFKSQLSGKNEEINSLKEQLEDYDNIVSQNEKLMNDNRKLEAIKKIKIAELYGSMRNEEYLSTLKKLILKDKRLSEFILNKLNLKAELMEQADSIYQQRFIDEEMELDRIKEQKMLLIREVEDLEQIFEINKTNTDTKIQPSLNNYNNTIIFTQNSSEHSSLFIDETTFKEEFRYALNKEENNYDFNLHEKIKTNNVIIIDDKRDIYTWLACQGLDFKPLEVIVEYNWTTYENWFGHFENNEFCPARTLISDYYKFVKESGNQALGVIIFNDFNKILPEIYLEPFIQNLEVNGYIDLINPNYKVNEKDFIFKRIEQLENLKFILVKSKENDAFDIPQTFSKYEVENNG